VPGERAILCDRSNNDVTAVGSGQQRCGIGGVAAAACRRTVGVMEDCGADGACGVALGRVRRGSEPDGARKRPYGTVTRAGHPGHVATGPANAGPAHHKPRSGVLAATLKHPASPCCRRVCAAA
jgi:hypothetical protein